MPGFIYKIVNLNNGKFYVGSTVNLAIRFKTHRNRLRRNAHHCAHLQSSWNKHGEHSFVFNIIQRIEDTTKLEALEDEYLAREYGTPLCYNTGRSAKAPWRGVSGPGHPSHGREVSVEQREATSAFLTQAYRSGAITHPRLGKTLTDESREKISRNRTGKMAGENHYRYGKTLSEEVRKKIGDTQRGVAKAPRVLTEEGLAKIRASAAAGNYSNWKGKTHSDETKEKLRFEVVVTAPDGTEQTFKGVQAAGLALGVPYPFLSKHAAAGTSPSRGKMAGYKVHIDQRKRVKTH